MKKLLFILIVCCSLNGFGQNHYNKDGQKHGYWVEYLNDKLRPCKKKKASFYKYRYYYNGLGIARDDYITNMTSKNIELQGNNSVPDSVVILNGTYNIISRSGARWQWVYKDGYPLTKKLIANNEYVVEVYDYSEPFKSQEGTLSVIKYDLNGKGVIVFKGHLRRSKGKWGVWSESAPE